MRLCPAFLCFSPPSLSKAWSSSPRSSCFLSFTMQAERSNNRAGLEWAKNLGEVVRGWALARSFFSFSCFWETPAMQAMILKLRGLEKACTCKTTKWRLFDCFCLQKSRFLTSRLVWTFWRFIQQRSQSMEISVGSERRGERLLEIQKLKVKTLALEK